MSSYSSSRRYRPRTCGTNESSIPVAQMNVSCSSESVIVQGFQHAQSTQTERRWDDQIDRAVLGVAAKAAVDAGVGVVGGELAVNGSEAREAVRGLGIGGRDVVDHGTEDGEG